MKIVVTGGNGYIGCALKQALGSMDDIYGDFITIDHVEDKGFGYTDFSVESLTKCFENTDVVVHLAAVRGGNEISLFNDNMTITERIMLAMAKANVKKFVFMSSIAVYSDTAKLPWDEEQICTPVSLYGISKLACESICKYYSKKYDFDGVILRLAPVYGENDRNKRMIANFVRQTIEKQDITVNGKSESKRDFIYLDDVVKALIFAIRLNTKGVNTINIGSGCCLTNYEIGTIVSNAFGNHNNVIYNDSVPENMPPAYMNLTKAQNLGFVAEYHMSSAMKKIAELEKGSKNV